MAGLGAGRVQAMSSFGVAKHFGRLCSYSIGSNCIGDRTEVERCRPDDGSGSGGSVVGSAGGVMWVPRCTSQGHELHSAFRYS